MEVETDNAPSHLLNGFFNPLLHRLSRPGQQLHHPARALIQLLEVSIETKSTTVAPRDK